MQHDVMRAHFPGLPSDLRTTPYLADEDEMITAGLGLYLRKCLTVTLGTNLGGGCRGCAPLPEMTYGFLIHLAFCKKKCPWFIGISYAIP